MWLGMENWLKEIKEEALEDEQLVLVGVTGRPPGLLMHSALSMLTNRSKTKKVKEIPSPEEEAEASAYRLPNNGGLYIPSEAFYGSLVRSAAAYRIGRQSATALVAGTVKVRPMQIPLGTNEYEIDLRPAVVQRQRIIRARPLLKSWAVKFGIIFDPTFGITSEKLHQMLVEAGRRIGVLDFRPQHRGPFGTFLVDEWEEIA